MTIDIDVVKVKVSTININDQLINTFLVIMSIIEYITSLIIEIVKCINVARGQYQEKGFVVQYTTFNNNRYWYSIILTSANENNVVDHNSRRAICTSRRTSLK